MNKLTKLYQTNELVIDEFIQTQASFLNENQAKQVQCADIQTELTTTKQNKK